MPRTGLSLAGTVGFITLQAPAPPSLMFVHLESGWNEQQGQLWKRKVTDDSMHRGWVWMRWGVHSGRRVYPTLSALMNYMSVRHMSFSPWPRDLPPSLSRMSYSSLGRVTKSWVWDKCLGLQISGPVTSFPWGHSPVAESRVETRLPCSGTGFLSGGGMEGCLSSASSRTVENEGPFPLKITLVHIPCPVASQKIHQPLPVTLGGDAPQKCSLVHLQSSHLVVRRQIPGPHNRTTKSEPLGCGRS